MTVTLITGANKGIGYETVRQLIALGHTAYLAPVARSPCIDAKIMRQFC